METTAESHEVVYQPQPGPQEQFLATSADICVYGGMAGGGKTWGLIFEPLRHIVPSERFPKGVPGFTAVIFRRVAPQIRNEGGLWDESTQLYPAFEGRPRETITEWSFPGLQTVRFAAMQYDADRFNWQGAQIPFIGFDELTHFCLTPETEVLTKDGWKPIPQVTTDDLVFSMSPGREATYEQVTRTHVFPFDGDLVTCFQRNGLSYRVTPNHKMVVDTQAEDGHWEFRRADQGETRWTTIPRTARWRGRRVETVSLTRPTGQGHGPNSNSADNVSGDAYLQFLGWYLSEGCAYLKAGSPVVALRQTKAAGQVKLRQVLDQLPWRYREYPGGQFHLMSRQLYDHVAPWGDLYHKRLPRWVLDLPVEQLRLFWDAFVAGDGSIYQSGAEVVGLANEGLIDDLQEVATLMGRVATKTFRWQTNQTGKRFPSWVLCVSNPNRTATTVSPGQQRREHYQGNVHCLTVAPHHTFFVRHNGRCFWTGNSEKQFWYLMSRNRSVSGVKPYVRATTNPDADSWVADLISWWIDQDKKSPRYGLPIPERAGVLRWFLRQGEVARWADDPEELFRFLPKEILDRGVNPMSLVKSLTFIPASVYDNKKLLEVNPEYLGNLLSLPLIERERLLGGNWKIRPTAGTVFNTAWFDNKRVGAAPVNDVVKRVRAWDKAGTDEKDTDSETPFTAGVLMSKVRAPGGYNYYIEHAVKAQLSSLKRELLIQTTAANDPRNTRIWLEQEPGSGGKDSAEASIRGLGGYHVKAERVTGDKVSRALPLSAQAEAGNVYIVDDGTWDVEEFLNEYHNFPDQKLKDLVDAGTLAFNKLAGRRGSVDPDDFEDVVA